ncbi:MAG TPA: PIN domain-containing protein [Gammaproteobacteria bacterium]|nr:PIN domain-containing protein [Gammaproteobacteria bacterium]
MTAAVFVDTNVFVYSCDSSEVLKQPVAAEWLRELWREDRGRTSMQVLNEYYVTVTRKLTARLEEHVAWDYVRSLLAWEPQEITGDVLLRAREIEQRHALNWWDSLIVAAAALQGCQVLLTEDLQDGMAFGEVRVRNPFVTRVSDVTAAYPAEHAIARHRPRGRPRRSPQRASTP